MQILQRCARSFAFAAILVFAQTAGAETPPSQASKNDAELQAASEAADRAALHGAKDIDLLDQAVLHLPAGYIFIPKAEAARFSHALGNGSGEKLVGIVATDPANEWIAYLDYYDDGHVNDDDAKTWNADDMLNGLKEGTESQNEDRESRGFPPIEVAGWIEPPNYTADTHRLVWSALVKRKTEPNASGSANYNTYALGRDGHFELNLVADASKIDQFKGDAKKLLASLEFKSGHRYSDYDASTDRLAAYGLAALVGGVAAKKLGLLAVIAAFAIKFAKLIAVGAVAFAAGIKRFFTGSKKAPAVEPAPPTSGPDTSA